MPANSSDPTRRNERSRRAILDASMSLISEVGYDNVSIEAIAKRACVGKQTIYRWWPSKGAVVLEAATHSLDPVVAFPDTDNLVADLRSQLIRTMDVVTNTGFGQAYRGLIAAGQSDSDLLRAVSDQIIEPNVAAFGARISLAQDRGELSADADVQTLRDVLYGVIEYRLFHSMPIAPSDIDAVLEIAFSGVR
ncbi:TetR/AcrR family transcriptional regulator [Rhodococcoides yunnanense]|uniref:TetR/AcrR family transcriptional regulator n=1 Tax=Rhodococcoides yunnanense TaxID=278209 RepID=UPI0009332AEB|nr:TetR/AcrR family transcriptional regulator [Rhodococcus yunnanensis]